MNRSVYGLMSFITFVLIFFADGNLTAMEAEVKPVLEILGDSTIERVKGRKVEFILVRDFRDQKELFKKLQVEETNEVAERVLDGNAVKERQKYIVSIPQKSVEILTESDKFCALLKECKGDVQKFLLALELTIYPSLKYVFADKSECEGRGDALETKDFKLIINYDHIEPILQTKVILQLEITGNKYDLCTLMLDDFKNGLEDPNIDPNALKYDGNRLLSIIRQRVEFTPLYPLDSRKGEANYNKDGGSEDMPPRYAAQILVHIEPWLQGGLRGLDAHDTYTSHSTLHSAAERKANVKDQSLLYTDGAGHFHLPCVDQCTLRTDREKRVNFLVIGYRPAAQLLLHEHVMLSGNCLQNDGVLAPSKGVYQKADSRTVTIGTKTYYFEKWIKIKKGDDVLDRAISFELVKESKKEPTFKFKEPKDTVENECVKTHSAGIKSVEAWLQEHRDIFGLENGVVLEDVLWN